VQSKGGDKLLIDWTNWMKHFGSIVEMLPTAIYKPKLTD
jgi:hypothetical protein